MNVTHFLQELKLRGITLHREGESLRIQAPKGALTAELRAALGAHKQTLLSLLQESTSTAETVLPPCEPDPDHLYEPFPMSDLQLGFYMADDPYMEFHVRPHYYFEKNMDHLDIARYEQAWNKALQRHRNEIVVVNEDGSLTVVEDPQPIRVEVHDWQAYSEEEAVAALEKIRSDMMRSELPLERWPWIDLRVSLWREGGKLRSRIHYNHNNFFWDGFGTTRLLQEVDDYYENPDLSLPPLHLSFRDAAIALDQLGRSPQGETARRYWEERLPHLPGPPELPVHAGMERRCRSRLNRREKLLAPKVWQGFKERARSFGLTPSNALVAVYAEILSAWSNSRHFVLSNMMTRRLDIHPEMKDILGNFVSLYPLEIDLRGQSSFADRGRRIQEQVIEDARYLHWGGMQVMQAFNRQREGFGQAPVPFVVGSGLALVGFKRPDFSCLETSQTMLDHQFWELADGSLYYVWDILEAFFPDGLVDDMWAVYADMIGRLAEEQGLWRQEVLDVVPSRHIRERRAVQPEEQPIPEQRLEDFLSGSSAQGTALEVPGGSLSYGTLSAESDRLAAALCQAGVQRGERVGVVAARGPSLLRAVYGILKAGASYVPVDPGLPEARRTYMLANSGAKVVLADPTYAERLSWPSGVRVLSTEECVLLTEVEGGVSVPADVSVGQREGEEGTPDDLAYIIYTSGSTGRPKGVMIDHRGAVNTILDVNERFGVGPGDRILGISSFSFDLSVYDIFGSAAAGATLVYPDEEQALNPGHWLDMLEKYEVSIWNSAPPLAELLVEAAAYRGIRLPKLRLVLLSGDWIPVDLPNRIRRVAPQARVVSLGGATEASIWSILYEIEEVEASWVNIPYGYPMRNQRWYILDEWGREAPEWTPGELYIGGIGLARGYWREPEKTADSFVHHPVTGERIYRTGDIGRYRPGGVIEFLGRKDAQVKIQGHRIELGEIETVLQGCPGVGGVVVAVQSSGGNSGVQLVAHVVPEADEAGNTLAVEDVDAYLKGKLPDYMVPSLYNFLEEIPLNANGKVDRQALPRIEAKRVEETERRAVPQDDIEAVLLKMWRNVLKQEDIAVTDDFFHLGGQSFEAVRLVGLISEEYGRALSLGDIWQDRTVARLAARLRSKESSASGCLIRMNDQEEGHPLFLVHPAGGNIVCYRELAKRWNRPVYAFQAPGVDGRRSPLGTIPELAETYLSYVNDVQPEGPVLVGGWSSGGLIAYELAVRLRKQGRIVAGVVVIDSPAPFQHEPVDDGDLFAWFVEDLNLEPSVYARVIDMERSGLSEREQLEQLASRTQGVLDIEADQLQAIYDVFKGIVRGSRSYRAAETDVEVLVIRARAGEVSEFREHPFHERTDWGWQELVTGRVKAVLADGTHYTLLTPPAVDDVTAVVHDWLMTQQSVIQE